MHRRPWSSRSRQAWRSPPPAPRMEGLPPLQLQPPPLPQGLVAPWAELYPGRGRLPLASWRATAAQALSAVVRAC